jgi:hypothetical protein
MRKLIKDHVRGVITLEELNRTVKQYILTYQSVENFHWCGEGDFSPNLPVHLSQQ